MAGLYPLDIQEVKTATELLKSHGHEQVKQHIVLDPQGRIKFIFTTYVGAGEGDPCMCDEYTYQGLTSTVVIGRQERIYRWKAAWDSNFQFDPAANYDPDGDGSL
jgi:hypothetical protein